MDRAAGVSLFRKRTQPKIITNRHSVSYHASSKYEYTKIPSFQVDSTENNTTTCFEDIQHKVPKKSNSLNQQHFNQMKKTVSPAHHPNHQSSLLDQGSDISLWSNQDVTLELNGKKLAKMSLPGSCEVKLTQDEGFVTTQSKPQLFIKTLPLTSKYCLTTWCVGGNRKRYQILCRVQYCPILQCAYVSGKVPFDLVSHKRGENVFELQIIKKLHKNNNKILEFLEPDFLLTVLL